MLSDQNGISSKYRPGYFDDLHLSLTWYVMSILKKNESILLEKGSFFSIESSFFYWEFFQGFSELFNMRIGKINFRGDYLLLTNNLYLFPFHVDFVERISG